jgi:hypothetical protein
VLDDPLRHLDNDALNTSELMRDTNIELVRQDIGHEANVSGRIIASVLAFRDRASASFRKLGPQPLAPPPPAMNPWGSSRHSISYHVLLSIKPLYSIANVSRSSTWVSTWPALGLCSTCTMTRSMR